MSAEFLNGKFLQCGKLEDRRARDDKPFVLALLNISAGSLSVSCVFTEYKIFYCLALWETFVTPLRD
jgi:hypothetical protein